MEETVKERDRKEKKLDGYWAEMKRCLRLLKVFAKVSLMSQLEYRANFVAGVAVETGGMLIKLLYVAVVYRVGADIGVLTPDHILLFVGIYTLMTGFYMLYYGNFTSISRMVREGELDLYLVKPVSLQFLVTMRRLDAALLLPDFVAGVIMICLPPSTLFMRNPSSISAPPLSPQIVVIASRGSAIFSAQLDLR